MEDIKQNGGFGGQSGSMEDILQIGGHLTPMIVLSSAQMYKNYLKIKNFGSE